MVKRPAGKRIYISSKVDHLSIEADEWLPLCGQKSERSFIPVIEDVPDRIKHYYFGRLCVRCAALANGDA
jgi:hypothetical protein